MVGTLLTAALNQAATSPVSQMRALRPGEMALAAAPAAWASSWSVARSACHSLSPSAWISQHLPLYL